MTWWLRLAAKREQLRASLWFWPAVSLVAAIAAGILLPRLESGVGVDALGFAGTPEGARAVLSTVAGSTITVTGLTFSLTVVALQVAASQFTPRLLGTFLADRGNQAVLSVFLGTFAYTLAVLRSVRSASEGRGAFVPDVAVGVGLVLTLLSVAMLVFFFHHLTQQLRVESVLAEVQRDTLALIRSHLPQLDAERAALRAPTVPPHAVTLRALRSGYLQAVEPGALLRAAEGEDVTISLRPPIGSHVTEGSTLAWAWRRDGEAIDTDLDTLTRAVHGAIHLGGVRTLQQDVAFGVRQLVDIAARALSPGVNDPTTAVAAIGALATVMAQLAGRQLGPIVRRNDAGAVRAVLAQPTFAEILALACDQPRRYGRTEPAVLTELLRMLTDLAEVAEHDEVRSAVRSQVEVTLTSAEGAGMEEHELARVRTFARHARAALDGGRRVAAVPAEAEEPAN